MGAKRARSSLAGLTLAVAVTAACATLATPRIARADVVDDAYAAGSEAANAGDWASAAEHWQHALELLPGRSAQLDYDLGTAYAELGELGRATYHLERALQPEARPSVELAELTRRNLGVVRRQAEVAAKADDAQISQPPSWWDLAIAAMAGPALAWLSMIAGWALLLVVLARAWARRRPAGADPGKERVSSVAAWTLALILAIGGGLHALSWSAIHQHPEAIVLDMTVELRDGPGAHSPIALRVQGGSRVRVLEERSGWTRVRLPAGLEGWTKSESIARLDRMVRTGVRAAD
ncbi:SH3 domain-containing protein [Pseudenhygromyxa sp. WMMC2535]|uniref:SH3 domain-containing protein n=1 Tax=Pseudenhygromyxa sp. WMMC2535 TaxID=2712867 RepID=UPI0015534F35|nr:SH3 domain-containing protein [Pseudenhygromyxa sp. WMMC2535]